MGRRRPYLGQKAGFDDSLISLGIACSLMDLQAKSMGLGTAILTPDEKMAKKALGLKKDERCFVLLALGWREKWAINPKRDRRGFEEVVEYVFSDKK